MSRRYLVATCLLTVMLTGCLGRLIADKSMSDEDPKECDTLVGPIKSRFQLANARIPPGLRDFMRSQALPFHDIYPTEEPPSVVCHTEVRGLLLTLYTVVELWRVSDPHVQTVIVEVIRTERSRLPQAKPTLVRFREREIFIVFGNANAGGWKRGEERVLRAVVIR